MMYDVLNSASSGICGMFQLGDPDLKEGKFELSILSSIFYVDYIIIIIVTTEG